MTKRYNLGSAWMILASLLFASMGIIVKHASSSLDMTAYELAFWRSLLPALVIFFGTCLRKQTLKTPFLTGHLKRSVAGTTALLLSFYGLSHLPLATAVTLNYTSVVFIAVLSVFGISEKPTPKTWLALPMGLFGIFLMLRPAFDGRLLFETLITLSGGIFTAFALLQVRSLSLMGEPAWRIVFYFSAVASLISMILAVVTGWHGLNSDSLPYILGIGITGLLAQLVMTHAYHVGEKFTVASLSYLTVVFSVVYGVVFIGEPIGVIEIIGILAVILAGIVSSVPSRSKE